MTTGPHAAIPVTTARERFAARLFDTLWDTYRRRVSYVQTYEQVIRKAGGDFLQRPHRLPHVCLPAAANGNCQHFADLRGPGLPGGRQLSLRGQAAQRDPLPARQSAVSQALHLGAEGLGAAGRPAGDHRSRGPQPPAAGQRASAGRAAKSRQRVHSLDSPIRPMLPTRLLAQVVAQFHELPWLLPRREDVVELNKVSQYAAWVLVHGYNVNHFTSLINSHGVPALDDIEKTIAALAAAGVPMKAEIEGGARQQAPPERHRGGEDRRAGRRSGSAGEDALDVRLLSSWPSATRWSIRHRQARPL